MRTFLSFFILFISHFATANLLYSAKDEKVLIEKTYNDNIKLQDSISLKESFNTALKNSSSSYEKKIISAVFNILKAENYLQYEDDLNTYSDTHFRNAIIAAKNINSNSLLVFSNLHYAAYLYRYGQMAKALPYYLANANILREISASTVPNLAETYKLMGFYFGTLGDRTLSIKYLQLAEKKIKNDDRELATVQDNIGYFYLLDEKYSQALGYFKSAQALALKVKDHERYAKTLGNIGIYHYKTGNYKLAEKYILEDLELSNKLNSDKNSMFAMINLSRVYLKLNDITNAQKYIDLAEGYAESKSYYKSHSYQIAEIQLELAKKTNNEAKELQFRRKIEHLEAMLENADGDNALTKTNWAFQIQKFNDNLKLQQEKSKTEQLTLYGSIILLLLLLVLLGFIYVAKNRKTNFEKQQKDNKITNLQLEISLAEQKLNNTNQSLTSYREVLSQKNRQIENLTQQIQHNIKKQEDTNKLNTVLQSHLMTEENWLNFKKIFIAEQPDYFQHLKSNFPDLTDANLRLLMLMKLGLSSREISNTLGITTDAIKKAKQRLKKKYEEKYEELL